MKTGFIGKLAELRIIASTRGSMTVDEIADACRVCEAYKNRSGGSFKMAIDKSTQVVEDKIREQLVQDLRVGYDRIMIYLEFRVNYNEVVDGMAYESFSIGSFDWVQVVQ